MRAHSARALVAIATTACVAASCSGARGGGASGERQASASAEPSIARNPVLDRDFPDPTVIRTSSGDYYAYATQTIGASGTTNIQVARSTDLLGWTHLGDALPDKPVWAKTTQDFWAPHVLEHDGRFFMYYSAVPDDSSGDEYCLAVATSSSPQGPFEDAGRPLLCGVEIDPMVVREHEGDRWFMYWASGGNIVVQALSSDLMHLEGTAPLTLLLGWNARIERPYEHLVEGPWVVYRRGWYFLFYSGDSCCEFPAHYAVLVARARDPEGPFERMPSRARGSVVLRGAGRWNGPGHGSLVVGPDGRDWFAYHAIDRRHPYLDDGGVRRVLMIDAVSWSRGWPRIGRGIPTSGKLSLEG